jgi:hypothetical protein
MVNPGAAISLGGRGRVQVVTGADDDRGHVSVLPRILINARAVVAALRT